MPLKINQTNANQQGIVYLAHRFIVQMGNFVSQALFVDRSDLLQQYNGITVKAMACRIHFNMGRQLGLLNLRSYGSHNNGWAKSVTDIVLDNEHWAHPALLRAYHGRQISKKHISAFYDHILHPAHEPTERMVRFFLCLESLRRHI